MGDPDHRAIRRQTLPLNAKKRSVLDALAEAYGREKRNWLTQLEKRSQRFHLGEVREIRNAAMAEGYKPPSGLPARLWKLALEDAAAMWQSYWALVIDSARAVLRAHPVYGRASGKKTEGNKPTPIHRLALWLLAKPARYFPVLDGDSPDLANAPKACVDLDPILVGKLARYLQRIIAKASHRHGRPRVSRFDQITLDADCYNTFYVDKAPDVGTRQGAGRQYLAVMTLTPRKRLNIPLLGDTHIVGNVRLMLRPDHVDIFYATELPATLPDLEDEDIEAVDLGYTEVMTDTQGNHYGEGFGRHLTQTSDRLNLKMKARNKLHALEKSLREADPAKAKRLRENNLGRKKLGDFQRKAEADLDRLINTGINELHRKRRMDRLVVEHLRHAFDFKHRPSVNRRLSAWVKGRMQDRLEFKARAKRFRLGPVNPAYGSQQCPLCDFVDKDNRKDDAFQCLLCGHSGHADRIAAINYRARWRDPEITLYTPYRQVKGILLGRHQRRLETGGGVPPGTLSKGTVPGMTVDTVEAAGPQPSQRQGGKGAGRHRPHPARRGGGEAPPPPPGGHSQSETMAIDPLNAGVKTAGDHD